MTVVDPASTGALPRGPACCRLPAGHVLSTARRSAGPVRHAACARTPYLLGMGLDLNCYNTKTALTLITSI